MVSVRIQGGLGNQLFQYAAAYSLAKRLKTELCVETSFFDEQTPREDFTPRDYLLHTLGINAPKITKRQRARLSSAPVAGAKESVCALLWRKVRRIPIRFVEVTPTFDPAVFEMSDHLHLDGYFQDCRYAEPARDHIKALVMKAKNQAGSLQKNLPADAICLHIRRGDYATRRDVAQLLGTCGDEYYKSALKFLRARGVQSSVFVFSDDVQYANMLFTDVPNIKVCEPSQGRDATVQDFFAMMSCKHFIISNSSYSYWAAWLAAEKDSFVCCPSPWYRRSDWQSYSPAPTQWNSLPRD